jgi:TRAP-type C4-dicarboxylate transport system permease small subunit
VSDHGRSDSVTTQRNDRSSARPAGAAALRVFDFIVDASAAIAALLLIVTMLATTVKVVFRYGLHTSLIGVDQISGMMLLYIAFLGATWVLRRNEHVVIDLLLGHVGHRTRWFLTVVSGFLGAAVCLTVAVFGTLEVVSSIQRDIRIPAEIELPRAVNLIVIPFGFLCMGLQFLRRAFEDIGRADVPPPPPVSSV